MATMLLARSVAHAEGLALVEVEALELVIALFGIWLLWPGLRSLRGTTLLAAWWWAVVSWAAAAVATLAGVFGYGFATYATWRESVALGVATTVVLPGIAVLGAKRPQHFAWQWIVLSLWVVLVLPAAQWQLLGSEPSLHPARQWFLLVLIVLTVVNYLPTRLSSRPRCLALANGSSFPRTFPSFSNTNRLA